MNDLRSFHEIIYLFSVFFLQFSIDSHHIIQSMIAVNGRLLAITTNGVYGDVTINRLERKVSLDFSGAMHIPQKLFSTPKQYYFTLHQCRCDKRLSLKRKIDG